MDALQVPAWRPARPPSLAGPSCCIGIAPHLLSCIASCQPVQPPPPSPCVQRGATTCCGAPWLTHQARKWSGRQRGWRRFLTGCLCGRYYWAMYMTQPLEMTGGHGRLCRGLCGQSASACAAAGCGCHRCRLWHAPSAAYLFAPPCAASTFCRSNQRWGGATTCGTMHLLR